MVKKLLLGFVGVIVVIVIASIATGGGSEQSTVAESSAAAESSSPPKNAGEVPPGPLSLGQTAQVEDASVTLAKARVANDLFTREGSQTVLAEFHITNTGDDLYNLSTLLQFEAYTADNRKFDTTISAETQSSLDTQLQPGQEIVGEAAFELPPDGAPYKIRFKRALGTDMAEWLVPSEALS